MRDVLGADGEVKDAIAYKAFGSVTAESDPEYRGRYTWTGRELDAETDLQYNRARYYDAAIGRWISNDLMGFEAGDSNLYRYVSNQPTGARDPSGMYLVATTQADADGFAKKLTDADAKNVFTKPLPSGLFYIQTDFRDTLPIVKISTSLFPDAYKAFDYEKAYKDLGVTYTPGVIPELTPEQKKKKAEMDQAYEVQRTAAIKQRDHFLLASGLIGEYAASAFTFNVSTNMPVATGVANQDKEAIVDLRKAIPAHDLRLDLGGFGGQAGDYKGVWAINIPLPHVFNNLSQTPMNWILVHDATDLKSIIGKQTVSSVYLEAVPVDQKWADSIKHVLQPGGTIQIGPAYQDGPGPIKKQGQRALWAILLK